MPHRQFSLASLLLIAGALPIWLGLIVLLPSYPGFGGSPTRWAIAPTVLIGVTGALYVLFRQWPDGWAIAMLMAPIICIGAISVTALISSHL